MSTVCVGCGLDVNDDGQLVLEVAPEALGHPNYLECGPTGAAVRLKRRHLRRSFTAAGSLAIASDVGPQVGRAMNAYGTVEDNGSTVGLVQGPWDVQVDGSVLINWSGLYLVSQQTIMEGSTGQVVGGRARIVQGAGLANIICSSEINDKNHVIDLAYPNDGPEFSASNVRYLVAGESVSYFANAYLAAVGQGLDWAGEFTITYMGEFL